MASRNTPYHVVFSGGITGVNSPGGKVFYVGASGYTAADGISPSDSNSGTSPQQPFSTPQAGLDACVSGRGDTVSVLPGSYTITAALTMTKDDVKFMSAYPVGPREYGPVVIVDATAATSMLTIDANNCTVEGIVFDDNVTAATADTGTIMINTVSTAALYSGTRIVNCYLDMLGADSDRDGICIGLTADATDAAPYTTIEGCTILDCDQDAIVINTGSSYTQVKNCLIYDCVNLCRYGVEVLATSCLIDGCNILCSDTATPGACIHNGVAAARLVATNNTLEAWGADTFGISVINTATQQTNNNWIAVKADGNQIDYVTSSTTPSADTAVANYTGTNPAATTLVTPTVDGT